MTINLDQLDEETKKKIQNLTQLNQSLEFLLQQKNQLDRAFRETELAIEELEKVNSDTIVYKSIGGILVKSEKDKLLNEKKSLKETLSMRIKTIEQKEQRTRSSFESLQKSLQADLQNQQ
jgi:prefoldin beta subunit